jgi:hypothetical protein
VRALALLPVATVLACGALTGCANGGAAKAATICDHIGRIGGLVISRTDAQPQNHRTFTFPAKITVTGTRSARTVARWACQLPKMPAGTSHCPGDLGISYRLAFSAGDQKLAPVTADITGCMQVRGLTPVRSTERSPGLWTILAIVAHLNPVNSEATFRGSSTS